MQSFASSLANSSCLFGCIHCGMPSCACREKLIMSKDLPAFITHFTIIEITLWCRVELGDLELVMTELPKSSKQTCGRDQKGLLSVSKSTN